MCAAGSGVSTPALVVAVLLVPTEAAPPSSSLSRGQRLVRRQRCGILVLGEDGGVDASALARGRGRRGRRRRRCAEPPCLAVGQTDWEQRLHRLLALRVLLLLKRRSIVVEAGRKGIDWGRRRRTTAGGGA